MDNPRSVIAAAPAKVILFGEHAINRGQPAVAAAVGLYARCRATSSSDGLFHFKAGDREQAVRADDVGRVASAIEHSLQAGEFGPIRRVAAGDYFAPQKYVLKSMFPDRMPDGLWLEWDSEVPSSSGLGSGGSAFASMVTALDALFGLGAPDEQKGDWAHRGDVVAHGGIASALDTQTCLQGGVVRFVSAEKLARPLACAPGLELIVGHTGVAAATGVVNAGVRRWLGERPGARMAYFESVGALSGAAGPMLREGDWVGLGRLFNLNQLVLEKIGVTTPEAGRLIEAALEAGAFGAKVSGSGGGGIVIALVSAETKGAVAGAIAAAGGKALAPAVGVRGAHVLPQPR